MAHTQITKFARAIPATTHAGPSESWTTAGIGPMVRREGRHAKRGVDSTPPRREGAPTCISNKREAPSVSLIAHAPAPPAQTPREQRAYHPYRRLHQEDRCESCGLVSASGTVLWPDGAFFAVCAPCSRL